MVDKQALLNKLEELKAEHRDLDDVIAGLQTEQAYDHQLQRRRLKKRKLQLKDEITQIESELLPDIIA
ncbi:MAG: YdcH family protein [Alphaproteobacteria bacterium]